MPLLYTSFILLLTLSFAPSALAILVPHNARPTSTSDVIGLYTIHPETEIAARPNSCPTNLTTDTFEFQVTRAPFSLAVPKLFNIQIDHRNTLVSGRRCESTGTIVATTSKHPFTAGNASAIINTWAAGGRTRTARWISKQFINLVSEQSFAVGYDFVERSCRGVRLRSGVGFLWLQPVLDVQLGFPGAGGLTLSSSNKYLILTFANDPWSGCVFVADTLGGEGEFPPGPVSDPSLEEEQEPETLPKPATTPKPTTPDPDESSTEAEETVSPEPDDPEDETPLGESPEEDDPDADESDEEENDDEEEEEDDPPDDVDSIFAGGGDDDLEEEPACFPASAMVELQGGQILRLADLEIGHKVRVSESHYSDIYFFSHKHMQRGTLHDFIKITLTNTQHVTLSPGHYLYVKDALRPARNVRVGDSLQTADGSKITVRRVEKVKEEGLIAPHTLHGDIVVNDIRTSTYTAAVHPHLAHYVLLAPVRALYHLGFPGLLNGVLDVGADRLRRVIPHGPEVMRRFL